MFVLLAGAAPAGAGRTPYGWLEDVETLPERGVELEGWVEELDERPDPDDDDERRRYYRLTTAGRRMAAAEATRLADQVRVARARKLLRPGLS